MLDKNYRHGIIFVFIAPSYRVSIHQPTFILIHSNTDYLNDISLVNDDNNYNVTTGIKLNRKFYAVHPNETYLGLIHGIFPFPAQYKQDDRT
jgi:hypothetical protein